MAKKSWEEKLATGGPHEVKTAPKNFADIKAGQTMLIPSSAQLVDAVESLPAGASLNMKELRAKLAEGAGAEIACPVCTGIQLRIVAEVANAKLEAGVAPDEVTPVWRVIEPGAPITKKLEAGPERFMALRRAEGLSA
ncbi:MAG: hypothetical protein AAFX03_04685 [Pseudomonadota bacterium]